MEVGPFGCVKKSGGREEFGMYGIDEYFESKAIFFFFHSVGLAAWFETRHLGSSTRMKDRLSGRVLKQARIVAYERDPASSRRCGALIRKHPCRGKKTHRATTVSRAPRLNFSDVVGDLCSMSAL